MPEPAPIVQRALKRFALAVEATQKQYDREIEDLKFQVPEHQWDADARLARGPVTIDGVQIPARPRLSISKLDQPIQLVLNQERAAHLGVQIDPISEDANDDTAEVMQDLYRRIERDSRAHLARSWAFDRAVKAGRGCYRVNTRYCDQRTGHPFDQDITIERILHQGAVHFDPFAQEPDWSDGEWAFVTEWLPLERYRRRYGESAVAKYGTDELRSLAQEAPEWVRLGEPLTDEEGSASHAVLVAEYWHLEYTKRVRVLLDDDITTAYEDAIPEGRTIKQNAEGKAARRREETQRTVVCTILNGAEVLDEWEWNGQYIPLVPVIGKELQPFDAERIFVGLIGPAKDGQRMYNYAASNAVELAALEPKTKLVMYEGQQEGHEAQWQQANIRNFPYLLVKPTSLDGKTPLPLPQTLQTDTSKLAMSMALMDKADDFVQSATATFDPSLGRLPQKDRSGRAILALQDQADAGNSHFLHNLASISMTYEAKVVIDLMASIYDRPGRVAQLLDFEDNTSTVILNQPFTRNAQGRPVPLPKDAPASGEDVKTYNLRSGAYGVSVTIGKSWQTRLQQGEAEIGRILESAPGLMPLVGPTYFKFRDFPGSKEIAELLGKMRAQQYPFLEQKEGQQPSTEQLQAQAMQLQQQVQMLTQQLQQAGQIIQTDQVKQQAQVQAEQVKQQAQAQTEQMKAATDVRLKEIDADLKLKLEDMRNRTSIAVASIAAQAKGVQIDQEAMHDLVEQDHEHAHDLQMVRTEAALRPPAPANGDGDA